MSRFYGFGPERFICTVLNEMRELDKTKNYSCLLSLIEEVQILANRMEAGLERFRSIKEAEKHIKQLKKEIKELEEKKEKLNG